MKKNKKEIAYLLSAITCLALIASIFYPTKNLNSTSLESNTTNLAANIDKTKNLLYLSDLDYITENNWSYNGWSGHQIQKDKNQEGGVISLIVNGERRSFPKGLSVHAKGQVTFDISEFSNRLTRFIAKLGVDASRNTNGSIWFQIYVSNDGNSWTSLLKTGKLTGTTESVDVDINVEGYKYLRIYVDPIGDNSSDHGSIMNARFVIEDYVSKDVFYDKVHKVEYYDEILKDHDIEFNYSNNYKVILEREFVNKLGYWSIQNQAEVTPEVIPVYDWILSNNRVLEEVIEVGEISNGTLFLKVLADLYNNYKDALATENGYVYEKMMIALAAGYSTDRIISPLSFGFPSPTYDYLERFEIMKNLFDNNKLKRVKTNALAGEFVDNEWFKDYHVELLRMVMQDGTSNGDLVWLNGFTNEKQSVSFYMIDYVSPNFVQDKYYAEANREKYDKDFYLSKYNVPYGLINGAKIPRYWMVFANGGICWNASRVGQSMYRVNGLPATGGYQVGHELYIQYYEDNNGNGYWTPRYGNWSGAGSTWGGDNPYRYIFNWNNKYFADRHISGSKVASSTGYLYLGQANLNRYEDYKESLYLNLIANSYKDNNKKLETYFKSLEVNEINLDTYDYIINLYKAMSVKNEGGTITSSDWYALANKIIEAYSYHPVAMFDLLKVIRPYLEGSERLHIDRLEKATLEKATIATAENTIQVDGVRTHARQLLNKVQPDPMTFSFDGENGGKIIKNPMYQLAWAYSLDGGATFTEFLNDDSITLTKEEIATITVENDIIFKFMGLTDYRFTIDITKGVLSSNLFANDFENRVVGIDLTYEWRNSENDAWTSYRTASPDNTGDKTLYVRRGATGKELASDSTTYTFTTDNQPNTRKYVPVSHLSIAAVSTEATSNAGAAIYAIDGNYNTRWHSAWNGTDTERYITIKLDKPRYISAVEFVPAGGGNGRIVDGTILGSTDGETWEKLAERKGISYSTQANTIEQAIEFTQNFEIENPKEVTYIKIVADRTNGNWFTARAFNLFQDLTNNERPTAGVGYSTENPTTENVIARLVNVSVESYEILSEGGDTHEFTENGEFTFRFRDKETGLEGSATAKVDWIDRESPTATIEYSTTNPTNGTVIATLKPSEDVIVTNNGEYQIDEDGNIVDQNGNVIEGYEVDEDGNIKNEDGSIIGNMNTFTYEFISNGSFKFEFQDAAGNKGSETARVNWIDKDAPIATITYDIKDLTNKDVRASITFNEENVTVTNNNGKTDYVFTQNSEFIFEFEDNAGNTGTAIAKVDWIDKDAPTAELKYEKHDNKVIVSVINPSKEITFKEGNGIYEYTKNGEYEIVFYDTLGNIGKLIAKVDSIKEEIKEEEKPNKPDDNKPTNPDKPNTDNPTINPGENTNKPTDNNSNSSNSNNTIKPNENTNTNKPDNNNNSNTNNNTEKPNNKPTNSDKENNNTSNNNQSEEENKTTYEKEVTVKRNKVMLVVVTATISLLALSIYVIKKLK